MTPATLILTLLLRAQSPAPVIFWCVAGSVAGIFLFVRGFRLLQRRRLILDTPFSKVRSASMGMVEVSGLAVGPYTMTAPITERPCYYYRTLVWELKQRGKNKEWVKVAAECSHLPFFLDDNTGRVLVDPHGAELDLHQDFKEEFSDSIFSMKDTVPSNVNNFLWRHGVSTGNRIKVEEYCIKPKNALFILGTLAESVAVELSQKPVFENEPLGASSTIWTQPVSSLVSPSMVQPSMVQPSMVQPSISDASSYLASPSEEPVGVGPHVVRLSSNSAPTKALDMSQQQKIAAALVKAGISSPAAWTAAGLGAPGLQVSADHSCDPSGGPAGADGFGSHAAVVLKKGSNNGNFLISWRSQREIAGNLGWKCALMIPGGPALTLASLCLLFRFFHAL